MQIRKTRLWPLLAALALLAACGGPLKVSSARRTLAYNQGTGYVQVRNIEQDVFLVVELDEPAAEVFEKMKGGKPYFTAGDQRFEVHFSQFMESAVSRTETAPGGSASAPQEGPKKRSALLVAVVPRDVRAFELQLEGFPAYKFTADSEISERLKL